MANQVAQLTEEFRESRRDPGKLPSDTTINPQHQQSSSKNTRGIHISVVSNSSDSCEENDKNENEPGDKSQTSNKVNLFKKGFLNESPTVAEDKCGSVKAIPLSSVLVVPIKQSMSSKKLPLKDEKWENSKQVKTNLPLLDTMEDNPVHVHS